MEFTEPKVKTESSTAVGSPRSTAVFRSAVTADLDALMQAGALLKAYPLRFCKTLDQADILRELFQVWARMGTLELGLLNRVGGQETVLLARAINDTEKEIQSS